MSVRSSAWAVYDAFACSSGEKVFVAIVSDTQWRQFCEYFDLSEFSADESLNENAGRVQQRDRIHTTLSDLFASMDKQTMMTKLEDVGLPFGPINRPTDLFDDPHLNAEGGLLDVMLNNGTLTKLPALPIEMKNQRFGLRHDLPAEGEHSRAELSALNYDDATIERLIADGIVRA
jgi:crotonobetainyl-CoA:carnitine CoA-transferase CaiB-like acyl-CoA transferase